MRVQGFDLGKRGGVAGEVHFIGSQPSANMSGLRPALIACRINGFGHFSFKIKTSIFLVKPLLDCLHHSGLQWVGGARHGLTVRMGCGHGIGHGLETRCEHGMGRGRSRSARRE
jgi:hypothetical protein